MEAGTETRLRNLKGVPRDMNPEALVGESLKLNIFYFVKYIHKAIMQYQDCIVCKNKTDERGMDIGNVEETKETITGCYDCRDFIGHAWLETQSEWMRFKHWLWRRRHWGWFKKDTHGCVIY